MNFIEFSSNYATIILYTWNNFIEDSSNNLLKANNKNTGGVKHVHS